MYRACELKDQILKKIGTLHFPDREEVVEAQMSISSKIALSSPHARAGGDHNSKSI